MNRRRLMSRRVLLAAAMLCVAGYVFVYATGRADPPIRSDGFSYYVYLPSWFLYGDSTLDAVARDCCGGEFPAFTAIIRWPDTRRWVNAHPIGVAILQTPFFLVGHGLTKWSNLSPDGFTFYYQHAAGLAGTFWTIAGLFVLRLVLRRRFSDGVTAATLVALLFGTGLYHYATFDSSYSHAYSFFLLAALLWLTERWHPRSSRTTPRVAGALPSILLGVVAGLIVLTRHTNALFLLAVSALRRDERRQPARRDRAPRRAMARAGDHGRRRRGGRSRRSSPSTIEATGRILVSSYGELGFTFLSPHLWGVLFSVQKGLFFWSPLLLAAVAGFVVGDRKKLPFLAGTAVVLDRRHLPHRQLVGLAVRRAATAIAASSTSCRCSRSASRRSSSGARPASPDGRSSRSLATAAVALSVFQMLQYWNGVLPMADMTWEQYRAIFLRLQ